MEHLNNNLNGLLANGIVFYQKLRHYHWQVQGRQFFRLHEKFEELYDKFNEFNDEVAERLMMLGAAPIGTLAVALERASVKEDADVPSGREMVDNILADLASFGRQLESGVQAAEKASGYGTADLLTGFLRGLQKDSWMLRSFLNDEVEAAHKPAREHARVA